MNKEKELPKEVVDKELYNKMLTIVSEFQSDDDKVLLCVHVAKSHYEPIIDGLKKEVEPSDKEADHWEEQYIMADAKLQAANEQIAEKDKEIERMTAINKAWILKGAELESSNNKLMGLLKEMYESYVWNPPFAMTGAESSFRKEWAAFCKEHHITP